MRGKSATVERASATQQPESARLWPAPPTFKKPQNEAHMSRKEARITPLRGSSAAADSIVGSRIGRIVAADDRGLHVEFGQAQRLAKLAISLDAETLRVAIETGQPAVLVFENGDESLPIVIGLVEPARV